MVILFLITNLSYFPTGIADSTEELPRGPTKNQTISAAISGANDCNDLPVTPLPSPWRKPGVSPRTKKPTARAMGYLV